MTRAGTLSPMPTIGARVKALRESQGLSQPELALRVGISQPALSAIESGRTKTLRGKTLAGLCAALNAAPDAIMKGPWQPTSGTEAMLHESELLALWRRMTTDDQGHVLAVARALASRMTAAPRQPTAQPTQAPGAPSKHAASKRYTTQHGDL